MIRIMAVHTQAGVRRRLGAGAGRGAAGGGRAESAEGSGGSLYAGEAGEDWIRVAAVAGEVPLHVLSAVLMEEAYRVDGDQLRGDVRYSAEGHQRELIYVGIQIEEPGRDDRIGMSRSDQGEEQ